MERGIIDVKEDFVITPASPPATRANARVQRNINALSALAAATDEPASITELSAATGLSRTATESVVHELLVTGWLTDSAVTSHPGAGRPGRVFSLNPSAGFVIGVDIGAHKISAAIGDASGAIIASGRVDVAVNLHAAERLAAAAQLCRSLALGLALDVADALLIVAGSPGVVYDGVVTHFIGLPGWEGLDIGAELGQQLGAPVLVDNDCNLATLAERWQGKAHSATEVVYILTGNRTGAGFILQGQLYRGSRGGSGEIGALPAAGWIAAPSFIDTVTIDGKLLDRPAVFEAARRADPHAVAAIDQFCASLAIGISALVLALDPELVVIGGGISRAEDVLMAPLREHVRRLCVVREPPVVFSTLGDQSVSLGAVRLGLDVMTNEVRAGVESPDGIPTPAAIARSLRERRVTLA